MSEVKRAKLISFDSQRTNCVSVERTVRISIVLPESTEDNCPEYNYKDELVVAKKKHTTQSENGKKTNGLDQYNEENDDDVKRIAAEMEAKYGVGNPKKRKRRKDDYADIGMGYDESDSFIDNTEGYDEIVPKHVSTLHGGFYINCGALEFKAEENLSSNESSSSSSEGEEEEEKPSRVKKLESSGESGEEQDATDATAAAAATATDANKLVNKDKLLVNTNGMQKAIKKRLFSQEKIKQYKRNEEMKKTVRELLKEKRDDVVVPLLDNGLPKPEVTTAQKDVKKLAFTSVENAIESVVNKNFKKKPEQVEEPIKNVSEPKEVVSNKLDEEKPLEIVALPQNLPAEITKIIEDIKKAAANSTEGKVKFFTDHVNTMLFNLEAKCKCLGKQSRMKVYEHLAPFVKCRKETLIKRAKNVCIIEEQKKLKIYLDRLRNEVTKIMPDLIKNYEQETSVILQRRFLMQTDDANKSLRLPKRSFIWKEETKKLLKDVMALKRKCFILEGKKDSIEVDLLDYIKSDILVIWPEGWMSVNNISKHCGLNLEKKKVIPAKPISSDIPSITSNSNVSSNIISTSSALTITPVTPAPHKITTPSEVSTKIPDETIIRTLPVIDIVKTSPPKYVNTKPALPLANNRQDNSEVILIDEFSPKREDNTNKPCFQVIDLTDPAHRKVYPKKTKLYGKELPKDELTGSSALTQIIADSLNDQSRFRQNNKNSVDETISKKLSPNSDYLRTKQKSEGDEILKVMEDLKVLQKMSSPIKTELSSGSSPVSVIAFNKSFSEDAVVSSTPKCSNSFQDAFQKHFIPDFIKASQSTSTGALPKPSFQNFNSSHKSNNSVAKSSWSSNERHFQTANNNYAQQNCSKLKTSCSTLQSGSHSLLDDMFSNFVNEYGTPRAGNSKPTSQHK